jgi:two-component system NtrC family response regulator
MIIGRILVVEDDESLRRVTQAQLTKIGYETDVARDVPQALEILQKQPHDLVLTDLNLPGMSGLDLLRTIRAEYPETTVVLVTAYGTVKTAVDAMKSGAYDYLTKPVHPYELRALVDRVFERRDLVEEIRTLRTSIDQKFGFDKIIGRSNVLLRVLESAARVAQTDATVLIRGETGTGKELLAKAIHFNSPRSKRPFVVVNCGAIPRELLESELFGHVRGAFTGAVTHKSGKVETADGGTVFLDEIGEMPLDLQVRVLRLIQEREIEKVGASQPVSVDVRIIAATHRNLESLIEAGQFREDLYYRLAVVPIELPPLRARSEDIPEFVLQFFQESKKKCHRENLRLPELFVSYFSRYHWPGNIRQLQNAIERMVILCRGDEIMKEDLPEFLQLRPLVEPRHPDLTSEAVTLDMAEKETILKALLECNGKVTLAARQLGVTRKILTNRLVKYGIRKQPPAQAVGASASP